MGFNKAKQGAAPGLGKHPLPIQAGAWGDQDQQ